MKEIQRNKRVLEINKGYSDMKLIEKAKVEVTASKNDFNISTATGNEMIKILNHSFQKATSPLGNRMTVINIAIRNISDKTIATVIFQADLFDDKGNILDRIQHKESELKSNSSRAIMISSENNRSGKTNSYKVCITKTVTSDIEKIKIYRNEIKTTMKGEEVLASIKNISSSNTDIAIIATFKNFKYEIIGIKVMQIKDIKPEEIRKINFIYNPPEGEKVKTYALNIGEIVL